MRVYASSITEEQRIASGAASVAGTDREGFDEVKGLQGLHLLMGGVIAPFPSPMPPVAHAECL